MGIGIVLLLWAVVGIVVASVGSAILGFGTALLTRNVPTGRRRAIVAAALFPFLCLGWGGAVFVFQAAVNEGLLDRDVGMGDAWHAPLPNGYRILMIDVTDQGWVYNRKTQPGDAVTEREDAVAGVRTLQVAGRYILGAADSRSFEHLGKEGNPVDLYFLLDTQTNTRTSFSTVEALRSRALELGIRMDMESIYGVYSKARFSWFDVFAGVLFFVPPVLGLVLLVGWVVKLRRTRLPLPQTA